MPISIEEGEDASASPLGAMRVAAGAFNAATVALTATAVIANSFTVYGDQETANALYRPREEWHDDQTIGGNLRPRRFEPNAFFQGLPWRSLLADDQSENAANLYRPIDEYYDTQTISGNLSPRRFVPNEIFLTLPYRLQLADGEEIPAGRLFGLYDDTDFGSSQPNVSLPRLLPASVFQELPYGFGSDLEDLPLAFFSGQPDEDLPPTTIQPPWFAPPTFRQPPAQDWEDFQHTQLDEDFAWPSALFGGSPPWPQPFTAFQRLPYPWQLDVEDVPAGALFGLYDDTTWPPGLAPPRFVQATSLLISLLFQPQGDAQEVPVAPVVGLFDEADFWAPRAFLASALPRACAFEPEELPLAPPANGQPDEDVSFFSRVLEAWRPPFAAFDAGDELPASVIVPLPFATPKSGPSSVVLAGSSSAAITAAPAPAVTVGIEDGAAAASVSEPAEAEVDSTTPSEVT